MSTNRPIELSPRLAELCHLTQREANGAAATVERCNAAEQWRTGFRPFVRLGDAGATGAPARTPSPRTPSPPALVELATEAALHGHVVEVRGCARTFARTPRGILVRAAGQPAIIDRHAELAELRRWAVDTSARLPDAAALERSVRWMVRSQGLRDGGADLERLRRTRERVEEQLHMLVVGASHVGRDGLWSPELAQLRGEAQRSVCEWDGCFADLAHAALLEEGVTLLFNPVGRHRQHAIGACLRCRSSRWLEECVAFASRARVMAVCPICGAQEVWQPGDLRLRGRGPARVVAGGTAEISVRLTAGSSGGAATAELAIAGLDKGRGRIFYRRRASTDRRAVFAIPFPADVSQDLHTVHLLAVRSLELAYLRIRIPAVPSSSGTPRLGDVS